MKNIKISEGFGHGIMSIRFAEVMGLTPVVISNKETKDEYEKEAQMIKRNLSYFCSNLEIVPFEKRNEVEAYDVRADLLAGKNLPWEEFAKGQLTPKFEGSAKFSALNGSKNVLMVPQKLISDGMCGATAQQQSLNPEVFSFLKEENIQLVLGQHFHKVNDKETVEKLAMEFNMYVPGKEKEDSHVFGIRGVAHGEYHNLYSQLSGSVGIAGTHTWIMLTVFPEIPQVILFNKNGVENWKAIEKAYQNAGKKVRCLGFDENTNMMELSKEIKKACSELGI